jgi:hypothetical protein
MVILHPATLDAPPRMIARIIADRGPGAVAFATRNPDLRGVNRVRFLL